MSDPGPWRWGNRTACWIGEQPRAYGYRGDEWGCYFWFVEWDCISLGMSVCLSKPNIEVHLPFGFVRIGRQ